jgi:hypothetical protein
MIPANVKSSHLAKAMSLSEPEMFDQARKLDSWFKDSYFTQSASGKVREIDPPTELGKFHLRRLARFASKELPLHSNAHGSVIGRSPLTAARKHLGNRIVVTRDVSDCFPSVTPERFFAEMRALGFSADVAHLLESLMLLRGRLPQGSPASNAALNLFFCKTDEWLTAEAAKVGGRYTRYCDDLVISVSDPRHVEHVAELLEIALARLGLKHNESKKRSHGVQGLQVTRVVNGVKVNSPLCTQLTKSKLRRTHRKFSKFVRSAVSVNWRNLNKLAKRRRHLEGLYHWTRLFDRSPAKELNSLLAQADASVKTRLQSVGLTWRGTWWQKNKAYDAGKNIAQAWASVV